MPNDTKPPLHFIKKVAEAPVTKVVVDKVKSWHGPKFLLGPLVVDLTNDFQNFQDNHNRARNILHGLIVIAASVLSLVFSQTSHNFRDFLTSFAMVFQLGGNGKDLNDFYYLYVAYMFVTYTASIATNLLFDFAFLCIYGDKEFHLTADKAQALATEFNTSPSQIQSTFKNTVQQLRQGDFTFGASHDDLHNVLKTMQNKSPEQAKTVYNAHAAALNACLDKLPPTPKHEHLRQYRKSLAETPAAIQERAAQSDTRPFIEDSQGRSNTPDYGTLSMNHA